MARSCSVCADCQAVYDRLATASGCIRDPWARVYDDRVAACGCRERVQRVRHHATCGECGRVFDLLDTVQASEWYYGHDCEAI